MQEVWGSTITRTYSLRILTVIFACTFHPAQQQQQHTTQLLCTLFKTYCISICQCKSIPLQYSVACMLESYKFQMNLGFWNHPNIICTAFDSSSCNICDVKRKYVHAERVQVAPQRVCYGGTGCDAKLKYLEPFIKLEAKPDCVNSLDLSLAGRKPSLLAHSNVQLWSKDLSWTQHEEPSLN